MKKKIALFPGSFDPFTKGHENLVQKALPLFDEIIIAIGHNSKKTSYFELESRKKHIRGLFTDTPKVSVMVYSGLTINLAREMQAQFLLRGLRDVKDFEYERSIAHMNHSLDPTIETVFIITNQEVSHINSSIIREIHKNGGIIDLFVTNSQILVCSVC